MDPLVVQLSKCYSSVTTGVRGHSFSADLPHKVESFAQAAGMSKHANSKNLFHITASIGNRMGYM